VRSKGQWERKCKNLSTFDEEMREKRFLHTSGASRILFYDNALYKQTYLLAGIY